MCGKRPNSYEADKSQKWGDCTFERASSVSLSRKPLSPDIEVTPKTGLSLSRSLVQRQARRLTGAIGALFSRHLVVQYCNIAILNIAIFLKFFEDSSTIKPTMSS